MARTRSYLLEKKLEDGSLRFLSVDGEWEADRDRAAHLYADELRELIEEFSGYPKERMTYWVAKQLRPGQLNSTRFLTNDGEFTASRAMDGAVFNETEVSEAIEEFGGVAVPR